MKRTYISPENIYTKTHGTKLMKEQKSFFGSKMMDIEDTIIIDNRSISYYQNLNNEQVNLSSEIILAPVIYSFDDDKKNNHTFSISKSQSDSERERNTTWDININIKPLLRNYIFANIKYNRTFEGVLNNMTYNNNTDMSITEYINTNIIDRYRFKTLDFYVKYNELTGSNTYRFSTVFDTNIFDATNKTTKLLSSVTADYSSIIGTYRQEKSSTEFNFNYYFTITFEKI